MLTGSSFDYMERGQADIFCRLSNEIKAFEAYMRLTPAEEKASRLVTSVVTSILQSHAPNSSLTLIGSRHTGLATPMSDLDFSISAPSSPKDKGASHDSSPRQLTRTAGRSLRVIEKYLRASAEFTKPDFVHARVPLVTSKHHATGLDIQVQTLAQYQSAQVYTAAYLAELPSLRPLYIVLRHSLEVRNLTTVHEGGLGSYTILMMIVTALKHSSGKFAGDDLGGQLLYILEFYGDADLYKQGFAANPPRVFDKANEPRPIEEREARLLDPQLSGIDHILQRRNVRKPYLLALQDPANIFNDLGKSAYAIKHIQETFKYMREGIIKAVQKQSTKSDTVDKGGTWSCLDYVVKADYKAFETARSKIQRCIDPADHAEMDNSTEAIRQDLLDRALKYKGIKEGDAKATNARQQINPSIAFRRIGQYITFRNHDTTSKSAEEPVKPITLVRAKQKKSKRPAGHLSSKNRVHKTAQIETLAFKSIKLDGNTGMNGSAHGKVPLDIMDEWAPSVAEDEENQGQGFKIRRQKVKPMRTQEEFTSPPDVSEGGKAF